MIDIRENWPAWLFFGTLAAAVASTAFSINYGNHVSNLQSQQEALEKLKVDYDNKVLALRFEPAFTEFKTEQILTMAMSSTCEYKLFTQTDCSAVRSDVYKLHEPVHVADTKTKQEIDADAAKIKQLAEATNTAGQRVAALQPIYDFLQNIMRPLISMGVFVASLFVILSQRYKAEIEKWAFGSLGTILGFWLK
jgi:hypothetical protein